MTNMQAISGIRAAYIIISTFIIVFAIIAVLGKDDLFQRKKNARRHPCYHTREDCENCVSSSSCEQKDGPGLIESYRTIKRSDKDAG